MQIVIDINEDDYNFVKRQVADGITNPLKICIANGTPLPKGHGALKDSDLLDKRLNFVLNHTGGYKKTLTGTGIVIAMAENLDAPTIIEADKESEEQV